VNTKVNDQDEERVSFKIKPLSNAPRQTSFKPRTKCTLS